MGFGYERFASFYDLSLERLYAPFRAELAKAAAPRPGDAVLDLACGTGQNLAHLLPYVRPGGRVVGVDLSEAMLARARARPVGPGDTAVFAACDARELDPTRFAAIAGVERPDVVVVALGLSVIPTWESVFAATFELLKPGGRYAIFDVYAERRVLQTRIVEYMAEADVSRRCWEALEGVATGFEQRFLDGSPHVHGGRPYLATGRRP